MQKAVFLDRDGVINREVDNLRDVKQLTLLPHAADAIRKLNQSGFLVIIITNQPVVARGWISEERLKKIHMELLKRLGKKGARIDAIYFCPHHPNADLSKYRKDCQDRKPNIGLIKKAVKNFKIALENSFLIGDSTRDIQTAKNAGIPSILLKTGYGGKDRKFNVKPDYIAKNLFEASIKFISTR
ncbi:hypothetical protein A3A46_01545 [Candidatus Roizmanbacteria bacterium RIFCSPLOWO2_01_FULL_37_13]|uniref:D,D-heptose 1,7-bisphosphate phosphatase n=1 Tax=Candidatus Roizmanbacteria bacterium RIFCSPHIGHO2_02_FULL_38_11 TaxID=1802039 RepID=A0A1F7GZP0_9BACT|nr:MAG: hypothetical protein A3C25_06005 [Candidatus Roizmanbacteria bacterium RIFCSPHIGHO2_02_FULL_38_11]OGK42551.1 MAG: hypothetical protein A3A46_01545 [Candidatus Roizmanbacteria bacterium RIFCSPLOWO2_01_FULL_37_13]